MKCSIISAAGTALCQQTQLHAGFATLGHTHVEPSDPDSQFLFIGNPPHDKYLEMAKSKKTIFNVLDICWHCQEIEQILNSYRLQLPQASKVTCISKTIQAELKKHLNIDSDVIYYPMKPVKHTGEKKYPQFKVMMAGRLSDPNKFAATAVHSLIRAGFNESEVAIVGPDHVGWGTRMGMVNDDVLNDLYNSVDYVICLTKNTGLELPPIEAACCGAIPIIAAHLQTYDEFWAASPLGLHYKQLTSVQNVGNLIMSLEANPTWKAEVKQDILGYAELAFRPKFEAAAVAKRIVEVYESI